MKKLDKDWFSNGIIDFEYKKYILLDYVQSARKLFLQNKLYPMFSDLISHYKNLVKYKKEITAFADSFPKKLVGVDWREMEMIYEPEVFSEIPELDTIQEIVDFSLPVMKRLMDEAKLVYEFYEENIEFKTVGIEPLYNQEGYILVRMNKEVTAYKYNTSFVGRYKKEIELVEVETFRSSLTNHVEKIKMKLAKKYDMPNPATFFVDIDFDSPMEETILPIIKRKFVSDVNLY